MTQYFQLIWIDYLILFVYSGFVLYLQHLDYPSSCYLQSSVRIWCQISSSLLSILCIHIVDWVILSKIPDISFFNDKKRSVTVSWLSLECIPGQREKNRKCHDHLNAAGIKLLIWFKSKIDIAEFTFLPPLVLSW